MPIVCQGQITITDLNDGINGENGKTYILNILNGVRSVTYDASGKNPSPSQTAFSCELYEDGVLVTPSSYSWSATGLLSGTSTSGSFTPTCSSTFSNANNSISLTTIYNGQKITSAIPISITRVGAAGDNAIIAVLSNETHTVPTDNSGNNGNYSGANTTMYIYNGSADDSSNWTVTATSSNVTGSLSGKTYTVTALTADTGYVDLTAARSGYTSITKRFTLTKAKQGTNGTNGTNGQNAIVYKLITNVAAIGKNTSGVYTPSTMTVTATSATGTASPVAYAGRFVISETTDGSSYTAKYTSSANESSKIYTPSAGIKAINVKLYLAGGTTTLLDEQTVPIVSDGAQGPQGPAGADGQSGVSITKVDVEYAVNTSPTSAPSSGWSTTTPDWVDGQYIWSRTKTTYSTGSSTYTNPACITGGKGQTGTAGTNGADGKGVKSTAITYQASTSGTTTPTGTWSSTVPTVSAGQFLWTRTIITYTDNTTSTSYSIGKMGEQGPTGPTGTGIASITELYKILDTKAQQPTPTSDTGWSTIPPTWSTGKYIHTCSKIVYTNPASTVYTVPVCDSSWDAINDFNTQQNIFNTLTNNGANQGIYLENQKIYINGEYIKAGTIAADKLVIGIGEGGGLSANPSFSKWSGTYPDGTAAWTLGGISKQIVDGRTVAQFYCPTLGGQYGMSLSSSFFANGVNLDSVEFLALEVKFRLISGTDPSGACLLFDMYNTDNSTQRLQLNMAEAGTSLTLNTWYTVRKVFKITDANLAKTYKTCSGYLLANWSGSGNTVKTIQFASANVYIATEQDYLTQTWTTGTEINGASISTGTLSASKIRTGTLDASLVNVTNLNAGNITSGTIKAAQIDTETLRGATVTAGTISGGTIAIGSNFSVNSSGVLTAKSANFTGAINSGSSITGASISAGTISGATISGGSLSIGSNFSVNTSGVLTATGANITGAITATSGSFTGSISSSTITGGSISGATLTVGSNFSVNSSGVLTAKGANITGTLNATSGSFSGNISSSATISGGTISGATVKSSKVVNWTTADPYTYSYSVTLSGAELESAVTKAYQGDSSAGYFYDTLKILGSQLEMRSGYSPGMSKDTTLKMSPDIFRMADGETMDTEYGSIDIRVGRYIGGGSDVYMAHGLKVTDTNGATQISSAGVSVSWLGGCRGDGALINVTSQSGYTPILRQKTTNGAWALGVYTNNTMHLTYMTDTNINAGTNTVTTQYSFPINGGGTVYTTGNKPTPADIGAIPTSASCNKNWNWSGQGGQPNWIWGGNDGTNMYVYNPSNFSVAWSTGAGYSNEWRSVAAGNSYLTTGSGDGASWTTHNVILRTWYGFGVRDNTDTCRFLIDARTGNTFAKGYVMASSFPTSSDRRLKENITPIDKKLEDLFMELRPVNYYMIEENDKRKHNGFIAQEVEEAMTNNGISYEEFSGLLKRKNESSDKENVPVQILNDETDEENIEYSLNYGEFTALNTHMIQKCLNKIAELEKQIQELQNSK